MLEAQFNVAEVADVSKALRQAQGDNVMVSLPNHPF